MTRLLIATTSGDKLREIRGLLGHLPIELLGLRDFSAVPEPEETGATFEDNARLKALGYDTAVAGTGTGTGLKTRPYMADLTRSDATRADLTRSGATRSDVTTADVTTADVGAGLQPRPRPMYTVAEDSGLVIDALDGEPGVFSARFVRPDATYPERFAEIYQRMAERPGAARTARFVCAVAVVHAGTVVYETKGTVEGEIAPDPRGTGGFGYDPIFYYPPYRRTLAEVSEPDKLYVAHRGKAFRQLADWLSRT